MCHDFLQQVLMCSKFFLPSVSGEHLHLALELLSLLCARVQLLDELLYDLRTRHPAT